MADGRGWLGLALVEGTYGLYDFAMWASDSDQSGSFSFFIRTNGTLVLAAIDADVFCGVVAFFTETFRDADFNEPDVCVVVLRGDRRGLR